MAPFNVHLHRGHVCRRSVPERSGWPRWCAKVFAVYGCRGREPSGAFAAVAERSASITALSSAARTLSRVADSSRSTAVRCAVRSASVAGTARSGTTPVPPQFVLVIALLSRLTGTATVTCAFTRSTCAGFAPDLRSPWHGSASSVETNASALLLGQVGACGAGASGYGSAVQSWWLDYRMCGGLA